MHYTTLCMAGSTGYSCPPINKRSLYLFFTLSGARVFARTMLLKLSYGFKRSYRDNNACAVSSCISAAACKEKKNCVRFYSIRFSITH